MWWWGPRPHGAGRSKVGPSSTKSSTVTHLLNFDFVVVHPRRVHLFLPILRFLHPALDVHDRLAVQALCPANHVLRDLALFLCEHSLQGRDLRAEDEEDDLGPYS